MAPLHLIHMFSSCFIAFVLPGSSSNEVYISIVVVCIIIILILALVLFFIWKKRLDNLVVSCTILSNNEILMRFFLLSLKQNLKCGCKL